MKRHLRLPSTALVSLLCFALCGVVSAPLFAQDRPSRTSGIPVRTQRPPASVESQAVEPPLEEASEPQALSPEDKALLDAQQLFVREHPVSVVEDWSDHTRAWSNPGTEEQAKANGTHDRWLKIVNDPRYIMNQLKRGLPAQGPGPEALYRFEQRQRVMSQESGFAEVSPAPPVSLGPPPAGPLARDWNVSLGNAGVAAAQFPAKFDSNYGDPSCTQDYMVYPVNVAGSATQAMIVGVTNVYPFCNGGTPTVAFAYRYTTNGIARTSPTISLDGTKIMFIESLAAGSKLHILKVGTNTNNVLTLFSTGTVTAPTTPANGTLACTAAPGCDFAVTLHGNPQVTRSAFYYDINSDIGFVGDDLGFLHEFTTVLTGTATEKIGGGGTDAWPMLGATSLYASGVLASPAYDPISRNVFVGDSQGIVWYIRTATTSVGTCYNAGASGGTAPCVGGWDDAGTYYAGLVIGDEYAAAGCGGNAFGTIMDAPLINIFKQNVIFGTGDSCVGYCPTYSVAGGTTSSSGAPMLYELNTAFTDGGGGIQVPGQGALACFGAPNVNHLHLGSFDNLYFNSTATGHLYWETADAISFTPSIWYMGFNASGVMTSVAEVPHLNFLASSKMDASPLTEIVDPYTGTDWLTASVPNNSCGGAASHCGGAANCGCVMTWNITSLLGAGTYGPWTPNTTYPLGSEVIDTQGNLQKVTLAGNAGVSSTTTPPWPASPIAGQTTLDGAPAKASGTGTVVTNNIIKNGGATSAFGTVTFTTGIGPNAGDTIDIGGTTYTWTANEPPTVLNQIYYSFTDPNAAKNLEAAIMGNVALCGDANCIEAGQTANASVTATAAGTVTTVTAITPGAAGNAIVFTDTFAAGSTYTLSPATGHLSGGSASGGVGSIAINGTTIIASDPTAASTSGTFTASPSAGSVTVTTNLGTETLAVSLGTAATASGTFTGSPASGAVKITNGANSMTLVANASATASATGTFSGVPTNGQTATVGGTDAVTASAGKIASATGTFSGDPNLGSTITITNGAASEVLTPSPSAFATATGTFAAVPTAGQGITITNGANVLVMKAAAANACATSKSGTFNVGASAVAAATNLNTALNLCPAAAGVTSANSLAGVDTLTARVAGAAGNSIALQTYSVAPAYATGTVTFTSGVGPNAGDTIKVGATTYTWTANEPPLVANQIYYSTTDPNAAKNLVAAIMGNLAFCGDANCIAGTQTANASATATSAGAVTTITASAIGTAGNAIAFTRTFSGGATYTLAPATGFLAGGANGTSGAMTGFAWTASTGTPACNSVNNPCDLGGGVSGVTSATTYAIDGVAADNATQLAAAINTAPNPANVGVGATSAGAVVTVSASACGSAGNGITLAKTATNFAWSGTNLAGGNTALNTGVDFAVTDTTAACAPLTTTNIAANFAAALTRNIGAVAISNPVTSAANVATVTANAPGAAGNSITLAKTLSNFTWNPAATLGGGANGLNTGLNFLTDGILADNATNLAAAITRNSSAGVPVTASSSGAVVTVVDTTAGAAGNNIALSLPAASPASGSFSFTAQPETEFSSADYPGIYTGNVHWWFEAAVGSTCTTLCTNTDYTTRYAGANNVILIGDTLAHTVQNVVAAINNLPQTSCGYVDPTVETGQNTCYRTTTPQAFVTASAASPVVYLASTVSGPAGNGTGACYQNYGFEAYDFYFGGPNLEQISPFSQVCLTGGVSGAITGYSWTSSTGTPPCNSANNPCNMGGGANGITNATHFATDGVLADDATQLAAAMNTAPNPANTGVTASATGAMVTASSTNPGLCLTSSSLGSTAAGFAWASPMLSGGSNGTQSATSFVYWNGCAELNAGNIAGNMVASINANSSLNANLTATNTGGAACAANCNYTVNANANGTLYDYSLATSYANTTFYWSCPAGTPASAMCGGASGVVWTYQSAGNGQTSLGQPTGTSGIVADTLDYPSWAAAHAYTLDQRITDSNGNTQSVKTGGTSGGTTPVWSAAFGGLTTDGAVTWENVGPSATANIYYGTLNGTGGNKGVKLTQKGLQ